MNCSIHMKDCTLSINFTSYDVINLNLLYNLFFYLFLFIIYYFFFTYLLYNLNL